MDAGQLKEILTKHAAYLRGEPGGCCANLRYADLQYANLRSADLQSADLQSADLQYANLRSANLQSANLRSANLRYADLQYANLQSADLQSADLQSADLQYANLSQAQGLLCPAAYLRDKFTTDEHGVIVYKGIGRTDYAPPAHWMIEPGAFLEENVNPERGTDCGCGVNVATQPWVKMFYPRADLWKCRIRWADLPSVVVPFGTDGKIRAGRVELIERIRGPLY